MIRRFAATGLALASLALALATLSAAPALAAECGGDFNAFLSDFSREAQAQKISPQVIQTAFAGLTPDPRVIQLDQRQGVFKQTFEQFGPPRVAARIAKARSLMSKHSALLQRIEQQFGVPGASSSRSGRWRPISAPAWASILSSARSRRSRMTAAAPRCSSAS